jgi:two-component system cell cycle sensor histidine kinase/response regulator CckA
MIVSAPPGLLLSGADWITMDFEGNPVCASTGDAEQGGRGTPMAPDRPISARDGETASPQSELRRLRDIIRFAPVLVFCLDPQGRFTLVNHSCSTLIGRSETELCGRGWQAVVPTQWHDRFSALLADVWSGRACENAEVPLVTVDGRLRMTSWRLTVLADGAATCGEVLGVGQDISDQKSSEGALRDRDRQLAALVEAIDEGLAVLDCDGVIEYANEQVACMWGVQRSQLIGRPLTDFMAPECLATFTEQWQARREGKRGRYELQWRRSDGQDVTAMVSATPLFHPDGKFRGAYAVVTDLTDTRRQESELRESQRTLSTLMSNLPGMAYRCAFDADYTMQFVSEGCLSLTGYPAASLLHNRDLSYNDLIVPEDRAPVWDAVNNQVAAGEPFELVYRIRTASGVLRWVWEKGRGIRDGGGEVVALEGFIQDITDVHSVEERLRQTLEQMPFALEAYDASGNAVMVNRAFVDMFGLDSAERVVGRHNILADPIVQSMGLSEEIARAFEGQTVSNPEVRIPMDEVAARYGATCGGELLAHTTMFPVLGEEGDVQQVVTIWQDVTQQRRATDALRLRDLALASASSAILIADRDGRITYANRAAELIFGYPRESFELVRFHDLWAPGPEAEASLHAIDAGRPWRGDLRGLRRDGDSFEAGLTISWVPGDAMLAIVNDITGRKRAQEALRTTKERLDAVIQASPAAIVLLDRDWTVRLWSPAAERIFGYQATQVIGKPLPLLSLGMADESGRLLSRVAAGETLRGVEVCQRRHDGTDLTLSLSAAPVRDVWGEVIAIVGIMVDITDSRRARDALLEGERRFREMADMLPDGVCEFDTDYRITYANHAAVRLLGEIREGLGVGARILDAVPPDQAESARQVLASIAATGQPLQTQYTFVRTGQDDLRVDAHVSRITGADGKVSGWRAVVHDVSERERLAQAQRLSAIGHLAAGVAHEFNNLLASMSGRAQLAEALGTPEAHKALVDTVLGSTQRGAKICRNLMGFARPRKPETHRVHLDRAIDAALTMAARELQNRGISVLRDYRDTDRCVPADGAQIEQVMLNLILNACQAMPDGGTLEVGTCYVADGGDGEVVATISDTGTGISAEDMPHIFEPFFTTRGPKAGGGGGAGLGLSVSHGIITAHGGTLTARSTPGVGSSFEVRLRAYGPLDAEEDAEPRVAAPAIVPPRGRHVLVAEDEADVRDVISRLLRSAGYRVTDVGDTDEAVAALRSDSIDAVVSDLVMPGGGGRRVLEAARELDSTAPILLITGMPQDALEEELLQAGARAYLVKPFGLADLVHALNRVLGT